MSAIGQLELQRTNTDAPQRRPALFYVDWREAEATLSPRISRSLHYSRPTPPTRRARRLVTSVDEQLMHMRKNVRGPAKAVLRWLAAMVDHEGKTNLDRVLDLCLRPGPDAQGINYTAVAQQISITTGIEMSAKRIKNAIAHLRRAAASNAPAPTSPQGLRKQLDALTRQIQSQYTALTSGEPHDRAPLRRSIATQLLAAVRVAAGHLIENDYAENLPQQIDLDELTSRYRLFVKDVLARGPGSTRGTETGRSLRQLLVSLADHDGSCEADMQLVIDGCRVVGQMMGTDSLPGVVAQLNVLVAGRELLDSDLYCSQLLALADTVASLHDQSATQSYMNWVRRLPEDQRLPSPLRVCSFCLNNVATHLLERLFTGALTDEHRHLAVAEQCLVRMRQRDSGFRLLRVTEAIHLTVLAHLSGQADRVEAFFTALGRDKTKALLADLMKFDNCPELVQAVEQHAVSVMPSLKHQYICV